MNNLKNLFEHQHTRNSFLEDQVKSLKKDNADLNRKVEETQSAMQARMKRIENGYNNLLNDDK